MSHSEEKQPIIIKKVRKNKKEHHGGSWKIAYADFVTAMMAFFMLLWLLSLLNKYQQQGVSDYFKKPLLDVFKGSKHPDNYKNQTQQKVIKKEKNIGGTVNVDAPDQHQKQQEKQEQQPQAMKAVDSQENKEKEKIKQSLEISLANNEQMKAFKDNLSFEVVKDGVKISLHDSSKESMFESGKADFRHYARQAVTWLSHEFNKTSKRIIITGHTDADKYAENADYTNWELSADRANAIRRMLLTDGMDPSKIVRIQAAADISLLDKQDGDNPLNRRVEVVILTDEAAQRIARE